MLPGTRIRPVRAPTLDSLRNTGLGRVKVRAKMFLRSLTTGAGWRRLGKRLTTIDWKALGIGIPATAATTVFAGLLATVIDELADLGPRSNWIFLLGVLLLVGWFAGGFVTGTVAEFGPVAHTFVTSLIVWGGWQIVAAFRDVAGSWSTVVFNGLFAVGAGLLGGLYGARRRA